jgi:hypothetical protein
MNILFTKSTLFKSLFQFAKWSKPKPILGKEKEKRSAKALGD